MTTTASDQIPGAVRDAYCVTPDAEARRISSGLINATWLVNGAERQIILQKLSEIFSPQVNQKIDVVTRYLASREFKTTRLVLTVDNELQVFHAGHCWRALSYIDGTTYQTLSSKKQARSAAQLLARFHNLMRDYPQAENLPAASVHDVMKHAHALQQALTKHGEHRNFSEINGVAREILQLIDQLPSLPIFPPLISHGDPKISNFLFDDADEAITLIDLDTIGRGQLLHELGDAFRSWCNPRGEDTTDTVFNLGFFEAALSAYRAACGDKIDKSQLRFTPLATQTISLELAARFCADALNESYFGWDSTKYSSASEHQLIRACGQLNAAKALLVQSKEINSLVEQLALE